MVAKTGKSAVVNIWVDPNEYAPGHQEPDDVQVSEGRQQMKIP